MKNNLLICDTETGGREAKKNPITQITIEVVDPIEFKSLHFYETFVKPYNKLVIEPDALKASRVSMQQVNAGVDSKILLKNLILAFKAANKGGRDSSNPYFVGHNFGFDLEFLVELFAYHNQNLFDYVNKVPFDTMMLMKWLEGDSLKSTDVQRYTLTSCCERMGIELKSAHGSGADVDATKRLFYAQTNLIRNANPTHTVQRGSPTALPNTKTNHREGFHFEF
jgi:DNA polymerase III epsilon subunit-like protein